MKPNVISLQYLLIKRTGWGVQKGGVYKRGPGMSGVIVVSLCDSLAHANLILSLCLGSVQ